MVSRDPANVLARHHHLHCRDHWCAGASYGSRWRILSADQVPSGKAQQKNPASCPARPRSAIDGGYAASGPALPLGDSAAITPASVSSSHNIVVQTLNVTKCVVRSLRFRASAACTSGNCSRSRCRLPAWRSSSISLRRARLLGESAPAPLSPLAMLKTFQPSGSGPAAWEGAGAFAPGLLDR